MEQFSCIPKNNFLETPGQKKDIYEASLSLANYLKNEKINNVMFLDNSARQAYVGLKEAWKKVGDKEKSPNIYFINPDTIRDVGDYESCQKEFASKYKNINPDETILLYDACIHSGAAMFSTKELLEYMGFKDIRVAITSPDESFPKEKYNELDLICLDDRSNAGCRPFGRPKYIEKNTGSIISKSSTNEDSLAKARMEHQKIKEVFNDQYEKNNS